MKYGCGEIERRGARFRVRAYIDGKRTPLGTYGSLKEAKSVLDGLAVLHTTGETGAHGETLRSYGEKWLTRRELDGNRSVNSDRSRWDKYIAPEAWAAWPLEDVRRRDIRDWVLRLRKTKSARGKTISAQTVLHCVKLVSGCFRSAIEDELVEKNPAAGLRVPRPRPSPEMWTYLSVEEQRRLATFSVCGKTERERLLLTAERLMALFAIGTGIRQGEQWNLELRDVHINDSEPWIFVRWGSQGKSPKNGKARRVPLFGMGLAALQDWLRLLPRYARDNPLSLAFPTERGHRRQKSKQPRRWAAILRAAGLSDPRRRSDGRSVRWHDLRHTCASSLVAGWWGAPWRMEMVRDMLGHSSVTVTERYAHLSPSVLDAAGAAMVPSVVPGSKDRDSQVAEIVGRATVDSNHRPSAPEADALSS